MRDARILVIEDEILIGLDIVHALQTAGFGTVEHVATEKEAFHRIQSKSWNAVVADANLNGCSIERVAHELKRHAIPFVIVTGYDRENLPEAIRDVPLMTKPFSPKRLTEAVVQLCTPPG